MKRLTILLVATVLFWGCTVGCVTAATVVTVDGHPLSFDVQPFTTEFGRTLVPVREIFEALDATVMWNESTQTITAVKTDTEIEFTIADYTAFINGEAIYLDAAPQIIEGRTMVPLRFVGEALGANVSWNAEKEEITVLSASQSATNEPIPSVPTDPEPVPESIPQSSPDSSGSAVERNLTLPAISLLLLALILAGLMLFIKSKTKATNIQTEIPDPTEAQYQASVSLIQQHKWAEASLALASLANADYRDSALLYSYAEAYAKYEKSQDPVTEDPYLAAYMADYYCQKLPDDHDALNQILALKIKVQRNLSELAKDPAAQEKHQTAQQRRKLSQSDD